MPSSDIARHVEFKLRTSSNRVASESHDCSKYVLFQVALPPSTTTAQLSALLYSVGTDMPFDETSLYIAPPLLTSRDVGFKGCFDFHRHPPTPHGLENAKIGEQACLLDVLFY